MAVASSLRASPLLSLSLFVACLAAANAMVYNISSDLSTRYAAIDSWIEEALPIAPPDADLIRGRDLVAAHSKRAQFRKDSRTFLRKLARSKKLRGTVPFAQELLKYVGVIPAGSTVLLPAAVWETSLVLRFTADQRNAFLNYHIVNGVYNYTQLRGLAPMDVLTTNEGSNITKLGPTNFFAVLLQDRGIIPKPILIPDLLLLASYAVQVICCVLVPGDFGAR